MDIQGIVTLQNSTISNNVSGNYAGGLAALDVSLTTVSLINSTLSGNTALTSSGGIHNVATMKLYNCTFSGNSASASGGGISNLGAITISNSIVANSLGGPDCFNDPAAVALNLVGNNWFEDGTCSSSAPKGDPRLGPLTNNGGLTQTHALLDNSGAIDAGDDGLCAALPVNNLDQRGEKRPRGAHCDIGSFEAEDNASFFVVPIPGGNTVIFSL